MNATMATANEATVEITTTTPVPPVLPSAAVGAKAKISILYIICIIYEEHDGVNVGVKMIQLYTHMYSHTY